MGPYFYGSNHSSYGISIAPILFIKICKIIFSFLHNYHPIKSVQKFAIIQRLENLYSYRLQFFKHSSVEKGYFPS